jgi:hypothetical protein
LLHLVFTRFGNYVVGHAGSGRAEVIGMAPDSARTPPHVMAARDWWIANSGAQ